MSEDYFKLEDLVEVGILVDKFKEICARHEFDELGVGNRIFKRFEEEVLGCRQDNETSSPPTEPKTKPIEP